MGQTTPRHPVASVADDPFWDLVATARRLQGPGGCPWDRAQTIESLLPHLIEETWEVFEVVRNRRLKDLQEELGDVLYTVLFLALITERSGLGSLQNLLSAARRKMVRRHPHVFGAKTAATAREAYRHWHASKRLEGKRGPSPSKAFRERLVASWERLESLENRPGHPVPNQRKRKTDRKAQHQVGHARIEERQHRKPPTD